MLLFANFDSSRGADLLVPRVASLIVLPTLEPGGLRTVNLTEHTLTKLEDEALPVANAVKQLWAIGDPNQKWRCIPSRETQGIEFAPYEKGSHLAFVRICSKQNHKPDSFEFLHSRIGDDTDFEWDDAFGTHNRCFVLMFAVQGHSDGEILPDSGFACSTRGQPLCRLRWGKEAYEAELFPPR